MRRFFRSHFARVKRRRHQRRLAFNQKGRIRAFCLLLSSQIWSSPRLYSSSRSVFSLNEECGERSCSGYFYGVRIWPYQRGPFRNAHPPLMESPNEANSAHGMWQPAQWWLILTAKLSCSNIPGHRLWGIEKELSGIHNIPPPINPQPPRCVWMGSAGDWWLWCWGFADSFEHPRGEVIWRAIISLSGWEVGWIASPSLALLFVHF